MHGRNNLACARAMTMQLSCTHACRGAQCNKPALPCMQKFKRRNSGCVANINRCSVEEGATSPFSSVGFDPGSVTQDYPPGWQTVPCTYFHSPGAPSHRTLRSGGLLGSRLPSMSTISSMSWEKMDWVQPLDLDLDIAWLPIMLSYSRVIGEIQAGLSPLSMAWRKWIGITHSHLCI